LLSFYFREQEHVYGKLIEPPFDLHFSHSLLLLKKLSIIDLRFLDQQTVVLHLLVQSDFKLKQLNSRYFFILVEVVKRASNHRKCDTHHDLARATNAKLV
jgi:hypothetical protein